MKSEKREYPRAFFSAEVLKKAAAVFDQQVNPEGKTKPNLSMSAVVGGARRGHDDEEEFFADYRKATNISYARSFGGPSLHVDAYPGFTDPSTTVMVYAETWPQILAVMDIFESNKQQAALPESDSDEGDEEIEAPVVFLGHGTSMVWKELRDHLRDKHNFEIEAYEIGARAGHAIRDILETMLERSSIAFLLMTADDETVTGELHPRLNVVHEAGLFQGRLGFHRAIIVLANGVSEFSNIHGIEQIRFTNIKEVFGDIVATIRREFPNS